MGTNEKGNAVVVMNEDLGNALQVDMSNVIFTKRVPDTDVEADEGIAVEKALGEFKILWRIVDDLLKVRHVRRIGMVATYHFSSAEPSIELIRALTRIDTGPHPRKFSLRFEDRQPTLEGIAPDIEKDDFVNVIYTYRDREAPQPEGEIEEEAKKARINFIQADMDMQRYYEPRLPSVTAKHIDEVYRTFVSRRKTFEAYLDEIGLTHVPQKKIKTSSAPS